MLVLDTQRIFKVLPKAMSCLKSYANSRVADQHFARTDVDGVEKELTTCSSQEDPEDLA